MFCKEVVGTANALVSTAQQQNRSYSTTSFQVAGCGNLGAGVTYLLMGGLFFPLVKAAFNGDSETAWRTVNVLPAFLAVLLATLTYYYSDDCPKGNYSELKRRDTMGPVNGWESFRAAFMDVNTWILFVQYACCLGVELTMNNATGLYFESEFGRSTETAVAIVYLWMDELVFKRIRRLPK
jgi:MFS transporter, NNP family, nitrate/nitrite transporter